MKLKRYFNIYEEEFGEVVGFLILAGIFLITLSISFASVCYGIKQLRTSGEDVNASHYQSYYPATPPQKSVSDSSHDFISELSAVESDFRRID